MEHGENKKKRKCEVSKYDYIVGKKMESLKG